VFFDKVFNSLKNYDEFYIIGGDFNTVLNPLLDKFGGRDDTNIRARINVITQMKSIDLCDIWRYQHGNIKSYTWKSSSNPPIMSRLDYFLISKALKNRIDESEISHGFRSDHSLVSFIISPRIPRGPGFWKLNTSLLSDVSYVNCIKVVIENTIKDCCENNPNTTWEMIKLNVRGSTIQYASQKKKNTDNNIMILTNEINALDIQCKCNPDDTTLKIQLQEKEQALENIYEEKAHGFYIRSKAQWAEDGEKSSKFFLNLERKHSEMKTIQKLIVDGKEITNPNDILNAELAFYRDLYSLNDNQSHNNLDHLDSVFLQETLPKLDNESQSQCEGGVTTQECWNAVNSMTKGKSPGTDGLPCEFYKVFWNQICNPLVNSLNHSYEKGELSVSQKRGIITLLPKKDKSPLYLKNWRPISLLNVDYKILTKVLATRMKKILDNIINNDQTGFLKGRYIGENVRLLLDIIEYTNLENIPGFAFIIDFVKAFDKIKWNCIHKSLSYFGFGPIFLKWIEIIYTGVTSCVTNNGYASEFFSIFKGVRQGCCLSPYLYLVCGELLSHAIRVSEKINGIKVNTCFDGTQINSDIKVSQYADDTVIYIDGTEESLYETIVLLDKFSEFSGLKVNYEKSTVFRLGSLKNTNIVFYENRNLKWSSDCIDYLGLHISHNMTDMLEVNFKNKLSDIRNTLQIWKRRNLTLIGKITLIKTFALSKLVYPFSVFPNPSESFFKELDSVLFNFVWNGKPDKIKRKTLILPYSEGGLGFPDCRVFCEVLKIVWVKRFYGKAEDVRWVLFFNKAIEPYGGKILFKCNFTNYEPFIRNITNVFVQDVVKCWAKVHFKKPTSITETLSEVLWYNSSIKINKKVFIWNVWLNHGIIYLKHIVKKNLEIMKIEELNEVYQTHFNWFQYYQLIHAIPKTWKERLKETHAFDLSKYQFLDHVFTILGNKNRNTLLREILVKNVSVFPDKICVKWNNSIPNHGQEWSNVFSIAFKCAIDSKTRNFHFKFLHRIIATNDFLYKIGISESNECGFCNEDIETLEHLFFRCNPVKTFWTDLLNWINLKTHIDIDYSKEVIFFGFKLSNPPLAVNYIILLAKQFIWKCKLYNKLPKMNVFIRNIDMFIKIENVIATNKNKLSSHFIKWNDFI